MNLLSRFPSLAWRMIFCVQALCFSTAFLAATLDAQNRAGNTRFVNPFIGTDGHGHTFPGATAPFGMVQLSPDTRFSGWDACGGYHYSDSTILGFSHTHLSGTGVADYGDILVVPSRGELGQAMEKRSGRESGLRFSHADEIASPGYYSVLFRQESIRAELTTTTRTGIHRYTFLAADTANILIDLRHGLGPDKVLDASARFVSGSEIAGYRRSAGWAKDQHIYFFARFSKSFAQSGLLSGKSLLRGKGQADGTEIQAYGRFFVKAGEAIILKVGVSSVSIDAARKNLDAEARSWNFDEYRTKLRAQWDHELGKIDVEEGSADRLTTFYTALYHSMIAPNVYSDVDGRYRGMDGTIRTARGFTMYTVFSLWDTFRAEHPLLSIIDRKRTGDFVRSLLARYQESSVLPVWELAANETWCMIGYHSVPVIVDAYAKGIRNFDLDLAFEAMTHSASLDHFGLSAYRKYGFIPGEHDAESVSKTLEYAYDDWCIAQFAITTGRIADFEQFSRRAQNYRNMFDSRTGFMRPKINSRWVAPFDPTAVTVHYTEANPWQYSFFVPHDVDGLIDLFGGKDRFLTKLDSLFDSPALLSGRNQADITGLIGQYAQGNEPSHHAAWLFNYAGAPWKTQHQVRRILDSLYHAGPDGLCGNDDCGQMSAWYVLSALGMYQVCPGMPVFCIATPLFRRADIRMENGKLFSIRCDVEPSNTQYIQRCTIDDRPHDFSYIDYDVLLNGAKVAYTLGKEPNMSWAADDMHAPHAMPFPVSTAVPFFETTSDSFVDSLDIAIHAPEPGTTVYYSVDPNAVPSTFHRYTGPLRMTTSTTLRAFAKSGNGAVSPVTEGTFRKHMQAGSLRLHSPYAAQYAAGGDEAMVDGLRGGEDFRLGAWQGFEGVDIDAVIDLGSTQVISAVSLGCLQDNNSWIFFPAFVEFSFSEDGISFSHPSRVTNTISPGKDGPIIHDFSVPLSIRSRYVKVHAKSLGTCPPWHRGAGEKAWLFADEITVSTDRGETDAAPDARSGKDGPGQR